MDRDRFIELAVREIDGRNSRAESRELARMCAEDSELNNHFRCQRAAADFLKRQPSVEPPAELQSEIMNRIVSGAGSSQAARIVPVSSLFRRRMRSIIPVAASLAAAVLLTAVFWNNNGEELTGNDMTGTIGIATLQGVGEQIKSLSAGEAAITVSSVRIDNQVRITLDRKTGPAGDFQLRYAPERVSSIGVAPLLQNQNQATVHDGLINITNWESGTYTITVELDTSAAWAFEALWEAGDQSESLMMSTN